MKEKLTLRNVVILSAAFLGLLFFCLSFAAKSYLNANEGGYLMSYRFVNAFWSGNQVEIYTNGVYISTLALVGKPFALPIIGLVLLLICSIGAVVVSFVLKNEKARKFALIGAGALAIIGGVFIFFGGETGPRSFLYSEIGSLDNIGYWESVLKENGHTWGLRGLGVTIGVISILVGCAFGVAPFLPERKLGK